jgi:phosphatidylserine/phosphatidylglycerophosphate/cardiolipin synthase-like enzyme
MSGCTSTASGGSLTIKLWRGERMCLIGMDVKDPEPDFVGFSIEVKNPTASAFTPLRNRIAFTYPPGTPKVTGNKQFSSREAPFQKFRWVHFPQNPAAGEYSYRVTKWHMLADGKSLKQGDTATAKIELDSASYSNYLNIGFTRGYTSSQAFTEKFGNRPDFLPTKSADGPAFDKSKAPTGAYQWLGFETYDLIFGILNDLTTKPAFKDHHLDVLAYDLDEPDIISAFAKLKSRLRIVIDNSKDHLAGSSANQAAATLIASAGKSNVKRTHFKRLQHNKVLLVKDAHGKAIKVLFGSTNFSFNGLYTQANNTIVLEDPTAASLFQDAFNQAWTAPAKLASAIGSQWHAATQPGKPPIQFCFSPHSTAQMSLTPVADAIDKAKTSVFFAIAFLYMDADGIIGQAIRHLAEKKLFSYGASEQDNKLTVTKPDGSLGIVDFAYLAANTPKPFDQEWRSPGIHIHNKFVVTDFNLPTATVFTGSSNLSDGGEESNGDNLVMIHDQRIATAYAIQAVAIFDHLHFAVAMKAADNKPEVITLQKPKAISGAKTSWFDRFYVANSQLEQDRLLFSH